MTQRLARIVPADPDSPVVRGVKVITADGSEIRGIKKLTLVAEPNSLWTAKIEMNVLPPAGIAAEYETTDITSTEREFKRRGVTQEDADAIGIAVAQALLGKHSGPATAADAAISSEELSAWIERFEHDERIAQNTEEIVDALRKILVELRAARPRNVRS